jgi:hypothetical protein
MPVSSSEIVIDRFDDENEYDISSGDNSIADVTRRLWRVDIARCQSTAPTPDRGRFRICHVLGNGPSAENRLGTPASIRRVCSGSLLFSSPPDIIVLRWMMSVLEAVGERFVDVFRPRQDILCVP